MGHLTRKVTAREVQSLSKRNGVHRIDAGLYLRVSGPPKPEGCSWVYRFMLGGKSREMGLGPYRDVFLDRAREKAAEARRLKADGADPIDNRKAVRAAARLEAARAMTFKEAAEKYISAHKAGWRNEKHAEQWTSTLQTYAYPLFGDVSVAAVDVALVTKALESIWETKGETAARVRGRIERVLDWATARGYRHGENPARWRGHLDKLLPAQSKVRTVKHHAALPYSEMPAFMAKLKSQKGLGSLALQFTILTAARTSETLAARWSEVDLGEKVWALPGERMKGGRQHRVPLSKPALEVLETQKKATGGSGFIFPGARPGKALSNMAMLQTLRRMDRGDLTTHGFRSSFRDWAAERTSFQGEVAEAALAHVVGDKVEAAYRRGDLFEKRRKLMAAWGSYATTPATDAKVIALAGRAR